MTATPGLDAMRGRGALPLVVAHGGDAALGYRNVLEALEEAIASGADMFEFDVRRTADDRLVVHHDDCIGTRRLRDLRGATRTRRPTPPATACPCSTRCSIARAGRCGSTSR